MNIERLGLMLTMVVALAACNTQFTGNQATAAAGQTVPNPDMVTCKSVVKTGTRIGSRECKTNRAWARGTANARAWAEQIQRESVLGQTIEGN